MGRDVGVQDPAVAVTQDHQAVQDAEGRRGDGEEVDGGDLGVVPEKDSSGRRGGVHTENRICG